MKKLYHVIMLLLVFLATACSSTQSLQEYYVDSAENPNFLSFDVPTSILKLDKVELTEKQKEALESLRKLNVLAFKKTSENVISYQEEKTKVKAILKNKDFSELMRVNTPYGKATIKYLGDADAIDEVVVFGDDKEKGFLLVRVLGKDMNPANMMQLIQAIQKSDYKGEGFGQLENLFNR